MVAIRLTELSTLTGFQTK